MRLFFFCAFIFLSVNSIWAQECQVRNHIFLIHGIGSDASAFGSMDQYLNKINPCYSVRPFNYNTGKSSLSTYDFSDDLNEFIEEVVEKNRLSDDDKISLIMHSQGGLVGSLWLFKAKSLKSHLYKMVDSFITLSTPYWGSSMAITGEDFFYTLPEGLENPISPFGRIELKEMSYGSSTIKTLLDNYNYIYNENNIRFLAIGGLKRGFNPYYGEDDTTVPVYSSRPDHFSISEVLNINDTFKEVIPTFQQTSSIPFVPVTATHFQIEIPGVANLKKSCLEKPECNHPSINHILRHLQGESPIIEDEDYKFKSYRVQIFLENWQEVLETASELSLTFTNSFGLPETVSLQPKRGDILSNTFSGVLKNYDQSEISIEIKFKKNLVRTFKIPVQGGYSTLLNLRLEK